MFGGKNKTLSFERQKTITGMLFLIPMLVLVAVFILWPLIDVVRYSFYDWNGIAATMNFVGFANYKTFAEVQGFKEMLVATAIFAVCVTALTVTLSFLVALFLDKKGKGRINRSFLRCLWFFPCLLSMSVSGMLWKIMFNYNNGIINFMLEAVGLERVNWLENVVLATVSNVVASVWATAGMCIVIFLAGLQSIDQDLYEAAELDGASPKHQLRYITLPMMMPSITINVLTTTISTFKMYEIPRIITNGGPGNKTTLFTQRIYDLGLVYGEFSRGCAVAVVLILIISFVSILQFIYLRKKGDIY